MTELKTITIEEDGLRVVVSEANILMGIRRFRLMREGFEKADAIKADPDTRAVLTFVHPNLIAATVEQAGFADWPISPENLGTSVREKFWDKWTAAVQMLNPHWYSQEPESEATADPKS